MEPWIAIAIVAGTTGLVVYLATRRRGAKVTIITRTTTHSDEAEK